MKYIQIYEAITRRDRANQSRAERQSVRWRYIRWIIPRTGIWMGEVRLTNRFHANYVNIGLSGFRSLWSYLVCLSKFQRKGSGEENVYFSCVIENWRRTERRMWKVSPEQQVDPVLDHLVRLCSRALIWSTLRDDPVNCIVVLISVQSATEDWTTVSKESMNMPKLIGWLLNSTLLKSFKAEFRGSFLALR